MSSSGSTRPSTKPRDGDIREQRLDAALVVFSAACTSTGRSRKAPQQQAPPDMLIGQSIRTCLRRVVPTDHEAYSQDAAGTAAGTSVVRTRELRRLSLSFGGSAPQRPKQTKPDQGKTQREQLRDDRVRTQARMTTETRRTRADECTIAGSRAEQSLTRGAERRLWYRPSRKRLQRRGIPSDAQKWTTRGTAESTTMPTTRWPTELLTEPEQPCSGITDLHAQCLEGKEFSSECSQTTRST